MNATEDHGTQMKEESEKAGLKPIKKKKVGHANQFHHFMANRWEMETVTDFIFLGSKITAGGDCSHEIKRNAYSLEEKLWQTYTAY